MTAIAVQFRGHWLRWGIRCVPCAIERPVRGSKETAEHVAELHNEAFADVHAAILTPRSGT